MGLFSKDGELLAKDIRTKNISQGAATSVWAAVGKDLEGKGGKYLEDAKVSELATPTSRMLTGLLSAKTHFSCCGKAKRLAVCCDPLYIVLMLTKFQIMMGMLRTYTTQRRQSSYGSMLRKQCKHNKVVYRLKRNNYCK